MAAMTSPIGFRLITRFHAFVASATAAMPSFVPASIGMICASPTDSPADASEHVSRPAPSRRRRAFFTSPSTSRHVRDASKVRSTAPVVSPS